MRPAVLALAASMLALAACGEKEATGNTAAIDQTVSAEDFATNDTTAIDAATGADANMAADVDINFIENAVSEGGVSTTDPSAPSAPSARPRRTGTDTAAPAPANEATPPAPQPATPPAEINTN